MEFLLEVYAEEMPASHVEAGLEQLKSNLEAELSSLDLTDKRGKVGTISTYGTCRRLIVYAHLQDYQKDKEEWVYGPPRAVSFSKDGKPLPAALGFAKSQGIEVKDLEFMQTTKGEYMGFKKITKGKPAQIILTQILPGILSKLSFPKMMRWGENFFRFSRPIKNILCLCDGKLLAFEFASINSTAYTYGHAFFSPHRLKISSFREFKEQLRKNKVIIDKEARKTRIEKLISRRLEPFEAKYYLDEQLLEKLSMDVEYPYVVMGTFPQEYLKLPIEILSTAMKMGQNLFSVVKGKKQLPIFMGVTDGCEDQKSLVKKGNERVLKARLADARFFWEQDSKISLKERAPGLGRVVFQDKLGSYEDKSLRLKKTVSYLSGKLEAKKEKPAAMEAAELCKVDLMTEMVREFPSLQGIAGGLYARKEGYPALTWKAIYEQYQPVTLEDDIPSTLSGAILSICDKLDSVVGTFGLGIEISGSKDPFGLRRQAQGVCLTIVEKKLDFSFPRLLDKVMAVYEDKLDIPKEKLKSICLDFFRSRLQYIFERQGYRYDLVNAVLETGIENIYHAFQKVKALDSFKDSANFEAMILIAKRVNNILKDQPRYKINSGLLFEKYERELHTTFEIIRDNVSPLIAKGDYANAQKIVFRIRSTLNEFFDRVLVMTDDRKLRRNRLALLQAISRLFFCIADYSQIVVPGNSNPK